MENTFIQRLQLLPNSVLRRWRKVVGVRFIIYIWKKKDIFKVLNLPFNYHLRLKRLDFSSSCFASSQRCLGFVSATFCEKLLRNSPEDNDLGDVGEMALQLQSMLNLIFHVLCWRVCHYIFRLSSRVVFKHFMECFFKVQILPVCQLNWTAKSSMWVLSFV